MKKFVFTFLFLGYYIMNIFGQTSSAQINALKNDTIILTKEEIQSVEIKCTQPSNRNDGRERMVPRVINTQTEFNDFFAISVT